MKDAGSCKAPVPIAERLAKQGLDTEVWAEGPALDVVKKAGLPRIIQGNFSQDDFTWSWTDAPAAIIVGSSNPMVIERKLADTAQEFNVPLVVYSDVTRSYERHTLNPKKSILILTASEKEATEARAKGFSATAVGFHQAEVPPPNAETARFVAEEHSKGNKVVLYATSGQPARFEQELQLVLSCAAATATPLRLIVKPNPKILGQAHPSGGTWKDWLYDTAGKAVVVSGPFERYADMTIAPSSGGLMAAAAGKIGVALRCAEVEKVLASEKGVLEWLNDLEQEFGMPTIRRTESLDPFLQNPQPLKIVPKPLDIDLAMEAVAKFAGLSLKAPAI